MSLDEGDKSNQKNSSRVSLALEEIGINPAYDSPTSNCTNVSSRRESKAFLTHIHIGDLSAVDNELCSDVSNGTRHNLGDRTLRSIVQER